MEEVTISMEKIERCLICKASVELESSREAPYTIFRCMECGPYSLTNELVEEAVKGNVLMPDKDIFRDWLRRETENVRKSLKDQGPLLTELTLERLRKSLN